jgi:hypothetical protein
VSNGNNESHIDSKNHIDSDDFKWDITRSRGAHDQYTIQSHSWKTYLYVPHCPQSSDPVKTVSQNTTQWRIGAAYRAGNYIINPGESYALYWSLEDKYENTPVRLSHDSQDDRDKLLSEWVIWCPEQSPIVTKTSEPAKEPDLSKKPEPTHERQRHHKIVFGMDVGTAYSVCRPLLNPSLSCAVGRTNLASTY